MVVKTVVIKFKDLNVGDWFKFFDSDAYNFTYIKISDRRYVDIREYDLRLKYGKKPMKSAIRQVGSIDTGVTRQHKGWR